MSNTKMSRNVFFAVVALFLTTVVFTGCGKESAETKNEASGGPECVLYDTEEDYILATDRSDAAQDSQTGKRVEGVGNDAGNPFA